MATIGNMYVNVIASTKGLIGGLGRAKGMLGKFAKFAISPAGLAVVGFVALTAAVLVTTKAIISCVKEFAEFDKGMSEVRSIMLDLSGSQFDSLEKKAKLLGATTANTATEITSAMAMLARAGFNEDEIEASVKSVSDLANATGMELAETADIIAIGVKAFGLEAEEAGRVADVLGLAASKTNTTVSELGEGMKYVAPVAKQLGFSIEETSAMLGKLADAGIKGSAGGTALRKIMLSLGPAIEKNGTQAFYDFMESQKGVTANFEMFGARAVTAAGVLQDMSSETADLKDNLDLATGSVDEMASRRLDNLPGDITLFESAVSGLKVAIGEGLEPVFRTIVQVATKFITGLQGGFMHLQKGAKGFSVSVESVTNVFKFLGFIIFKTIGFAVQVYEKFMFGFNAIKMLGGAVLTTFSAIIQALVEVVSWGLNAIGLMSDDTYDTTVGFMRDITVELGKTTGEAAVDMGGNFMQGFAGGAMADSDKTFKAFSKAMDEGLPVEEVATSGKEAGEKVAEAIADGLQVGADNTLDPAIVDLLDSVDKMHEGLDKQVADFGKSKSEILANELALKGLSNATMENVLAMEKQLEGMKEKKKEDEALEKSALKLIESLRTPTEVFDDEVANYQKMVDAKVLTTEQMEKAVEKLRSKTEEDIEVNVITKGIMENLSTALGSFKIAGAVDKKEQLAEKTLTAQKKIQQLTEVIEDNMKSTAKSLEGTLDTKVEGLESKVTNG